MKSLIINYEGLRLTTAQAVQTALQYHQSGKLKQAEGLYHLILKKEPDNADILFLLGAVAYQMKKTDMAAGIFNKVLSIDYNHAEAHYSLATIFKENGRLNEAITHYEKTLRLEPDMADVHFNLAALLHEQGSLKEASEHYRKVIEINPEYAEAFNNLGNIFYEQGNLNEAIVYYEKSLKLKPDYAEAFNNLATVFVAQGRFEKARKYYDRALELEPHLARTHFNLALMLLLQGDYDNGWKEYEWRWKSKDVLKYIFPYDRHYSKPLWDGSDIAEKTILLYDEQGFGDTIQFVRYAPLLAELGAKVIVECQEELKKIIRNVEGIHHVTGHSEILPEHDFRIPLLSLPLVFNTIVKTIPANIPYIRLNDTSVKNWHEKIKLNDSCLKIGLVWSGRQQHKNDLNRSLSLEVFHPILKLAGTIFYSLQMGDASEQLAELPEGVGIRDYSGQIYSFLDTAALIQNLDLIISVDTAVAHLAGALGKPVWTILPYVPDWRWMLDRKDSPWYPTMRLYRQPAIGDWNSVIEQLLQDLNSLVNSAKNERKIS